MSLALALSILARLVGKDEFVGKNALESASGKVVSTASVIRYLCKTHPEIYGNGCLVSELEADQWLDWAILGQSSLDFVATLEQALTQRTFLSGSARIGMADAVAFAHVHVVLGLKSASSPAVKRWLRAVESCGAVQDAVKALAHASKPKRANPANAAGGASAGKKGGNCPPLEGNLEAKDVVTRFPPEPSGHLHIGHCKALFLNQYYSQGGTLLLRFDDTNPSNEKEEYCEAILNDLQSLNVVPFKISHTSDHFDLLLEKAKEMIRKGLAFCDWSTQEEMKKQRDPFKPEGLTPSPCRDLSVEENLALFEDMIQGKPWSGGSKDGPVRYCTLRAKITDSHGTPGYLCGNGSMRDPALYRVILDAVHLRTGKKYKLYPTYDFACPIIDSHEKVTHVLRDNQYSDRIEQFEWIQNSLALRKCYIQQFSRVNFVRTLMSKRKLALLIQEGYASGWDDPRFPTVKGMIRRGMLVESVRNFMLELGGSVKNVNMEWDKIWSDNMRALDPIASRYMAVNAENFAKVVITDFDEGQEGEVQCVTIPLIPKDPTKGSKAVIVAKTLLVELVDIQNLKPGAILGLMRFCVVRVDDVDLVNKVVKVSKVEGGGDFRKCDSLITWVADSPLEQRVLIWEYDFLLNEGVEDDDSVQGDWKKTINLKSAASTVLVANNGVRNLQHGDFVQFERRGFFRVDKPFAREDVLMEFIQVPDGKKAAMSVVGGKLGHQ